MDETPLHTRDSKKFALSLGKMAPLMGESSFECTCCWEALRLYGVFWSGG
jgi:hypothetical protein